MDQVILITITATDDGSGVAKIFYRIDGWRLGISLSKV
jgi:hypothetical protein